MIFSGLYSLPMSQTAGLSRLWGESQFWNQEGDGLLGRTDWLLSMLSEFFDAPTPDGR
jgi:hypothetical protein